MKSHLLFECFNWGRAFRREYRPNFIPPTKDPLSPTNFDPEFTTEIAADRLVQTEMSDVGKVPGFSCCDENIGRLE
jgi:hypothetical protein